MRTLKESAHSVAEHLEEWLAQPFGQDRAQLAAKDPKFAALQERETEVVRQMKDYLRSKLEKNG